MMRSIYLLVLATLLFAANQATQAAQADPRQAKPTLPGPHIILTVPISLIDLPPEVDQYQVVCTVDVLDGRSNTRAGHGSAIGAIPAAGSGSSHDFKGDATVGIFIANATADVLASRMAYQCSLYLQGTAYEVTTKYMDDQGLSYQQGQSGFPLASGAPFKRYFRGDMPK